MTHPEEKSYKRSKHAEYLGCGHACTHTHKISLMPVNSLNGKSHWKEKDTNTQRHSSDFQTPLRLLSSLRMLADADAGGGGAGGGGWHSVRRALLCARRCAQVFIRGTQRLPGWLLCAWITAVLCDSRTTNMAPRQMKCVLVPAFMAANWCRIGQWSTLTALTSSSPLLTY